MTNQRNAKLITYDLILKQAGADLYGPAPSLAYGIHLWYMVYIWYMVYGIWYMVYGIYIWYMVYGIWYMVYGIHGIP